MKTTGIAVAVVIVAVAAAAFFWRESAQQTSAVQVLQERVAELEQELETAQTAAKKPVDNGGKSNDELKSELIRLRGEVTQRRESGKLAEKLQAENARLVQENRELKIKASTAERAQAQAAPVPVPAAQPAQAFGAPGQPPVPQPPGTAGSTVTPQTVAGAGGPGDPLAFYRRNPELMKRYFPQLYQQTYGTNQASATNSGGTR